MSSPTDTRVDVNDPQALMKALREPFPRIKVGHKPQTIVPDRDQQGKFKALVTFYVGTEAICERLDQVFGPGGWQTEIDALFDKRAVICRLKVWINGQWITKTDIGGERDMSGDAATKSANQHKSAVTDAIKRCATQLGVGIYLKTMPQVWWPVTCPNAGKGGADEKKGAYFDKQRPPAIPDSYLPEDDPARAKKAGAQQQAAAPHAQAQPQTQATSQTPAPTKNLPQQAAPSQDNQSKGANIPVSAEERSKKWREFLVDLYQRSTILENVAYADQKYGDNIKKLMLGGDALAITKAREEAVNRIKAAEETALMSPANTPFED